MWERGVGPVDPTERGMRISASSKGGTRRRRGNLENRSKFVLVLVLF